MLSKSTARRAMMVLVIALGFGLVLTSPGSAQGPGGKGKGKGFDKKNMEFDRQPVDPRRDDRGPGPRTSSETERLEVQVRALSAKLDGLQEQLRELKRASAKNTQNARATPEKKGKGPPPGKGWNKEPATAKAPPSREMDRRGPPAYGRDMFDRRDPRDTRDSRDMRDGPPAFGFGGFGGFGSFGRGYGPMMMGGGRASFDRSPSMDRGPQRGPQTQQGPQRERGRQPEPARGSSLESRLDRLIGELEALRREIRTRR